MGRPVDVPMAGNARESVKNACVNSQTNYGVSGAEENFGVNNARNIAEADRYDRKGYAMDGLNIVTGRSKRAKFTGTR